MKKTRHFKIADLNISITFCESEKNDMELIPSFLPFCSDNEPVGDMLFSLTVDDTLRPIKDAKLVRKFDTGNGDTVVYTLSDGGYQYIIRNIADKDCCLLQANADFSECRCALTGNKVMRSFGLNDALMLIFAFAGCRQDALLIHASCIACNGYAYPFTAKSGTGKSTHTSLWMKYIEGTELVNDDNPIIRLINGKAFLYGSPWSGKTPCYRNVKYPLGAITKIERAPQNSIVRMAPIPAFATILPACSSMKWDSRIYNEICNTITSIVETIPIYTLNCLPDKEAAVICHNTISK